MPFRRAEKRLVRAVEQGDAATTSELVLRGAPPNALNLALGVAASLPQGFKLIPLLLLGEGGPPAARFEIPQGVRSLLGYGPQPQSPLGLALRLGFWENASCLSFKGAAYSPEPFAELAAYGSKQYPEGSSAALCKLIELGCDINIQDRFGSSPLHLLARDRASLGALDTLISHGAWVNTCDNQSRTPLMEAAIFSSPQALQLLLLAGACVNIQDRNGNTALHLLCLGLRGVEWPARWEPERFAQCLRLLIEGGVNINALNSKGLSALHILEHCAPGDLVRANNFLSLFQSLTEKRFITNLVALPTGSHKNTHRL